MTVDSSEDALRDGPLQCARNARPTATAKRAKLATQVLGCEAEDLPKDLLALSVDRSHRLPDHRAELILCVNEAFVVLPVLLSRGVKLTGLKNAHARRGKNRRDRYVDGKTLPNTPDGMDTSPGGDLRWDPRYPSSQETGESKPSEAKLSTKLRSALCRIIISPDVVQQVAWSPKVLMGCSHNGQGIGLESTATPRR